MRKKILVVDDEASILAVVHGCLGDTYDLVTARSPAEGLAALREDVCDVLLTDVKMPGGGGHLLAETALAEWPDLGVVVMSGQGSVDDFIQFLHVGVLDFVIKPFAPTELKVAIARAITLRNLRAENRRLRAASPNRPTSWTLIGESAALRAVKDRIALVGPTDSTVLITGSSGTGKELAARAVHQLSRRAGAPFVAVNCGALPGNLLESELFGHVRGAFTGADNARVGRFEEAQGGTLFLDEVGTMPEAAQVRLLRALGAREILRVGEGKPRPIDVRIVAATNADLETMVQEGRFRDDLFYRLNVFPIHMPDLAERPADIPLLAAHLLRTCCERLGRPPKQLAGEALRLLEQHSWPGNVRELQNAVERGVILCGDNEAIGAEDFLIGDLVRRTQPLAELPPEGVDMPRLLVDLENRLIQQALERTAHNKQQAARLLGLQRTTLVEKLRRREESQRPGPILDNGTSDTVEPGT